MIGNDIVDLNEASKSRYWSDHRFINKVFSAEELALVQGLTDRTETEDV